MDPELKSHLDAMEERLGQRISQAVYDSETKLLGEFWKWARTADARYRQSQGNVDGLAMRVGIVEDRVAELERRPPNQNAQGT